MHHDTADATERGSCKRDDGSEIGVDRRKQREVVQPRFQRFPASADRTRTHRPPMIVRVNQCRQRQQCCRRLDFERLRVLDRLNCVAFNHKLARSRGRLVGRSYQMSASNRSHG
jgi:hypothetical protein